MIFFYEIYTRAKRTAARTDLPEIRAKLNKLRFIREQEGRDERNPFLPRRLGSSVDSRISIDSEQDLFSRRRKSRQPSLSPNRFFQQGRRLSPSPQQAPVFLQPKVGRSSQSPRRTKQSADRPRSPPLKQVPREVSETLSPTPIILRRQEIPEAPQRNGDLGAGSGSTIQMADIHSTRLEPEIVKGHPLSDPAQRSINQVQVADILHGEYTSMLNASESENGPTLRGGGGVELEASGSSAEDGRESEEIGNHTEALKKKIFSSTSIGNMEEGSSPLASFSTAVTSTNNKRLDEPENGTQIVDKIKADVSNTSILSWHDFKTI